jgi:hypothetical protein
MPSFSAELGGTIDCSLCSAESSCTGAETSSDFLPTWTLEVRDRGDILAVHSAPWAQAQRIRVGCDYMRITKDAC